MPLPAGSHARCAGWGDPAIIEFEDVVVAAAGASTAVTLHLPAAASAPGAQGTHWTTEVWTHNLTDETVSFADEILDQHGDAIARRFTARYCI